MSFETEMMRTAMFPARAFSEFVNGTLFVSHVTDEQAEQIRERLSAVTKVQMGSFVTDGVGREFYFDFVE